MRKYHIVPVVSLIHGTDFVVSVSEGKQHLGFIKEEGNSEPNYTQETEEIMDAYRWSTVSQVLEWACVQGITILGKLKLQMYWGNKSQYVEEISVLSSSPQEMEEIVRKVIGKLHPSLKPKPDTIVKAGIGARHLMYSKLIPVWSFKYCPDGRVIYKETIS